MPTINDLKSSKFLKGADFPKPAMATIQAYDEVNVAKEGAEPDLKWCLIFKEFEKPLVLNSTNGQIIASITGTGDFDGWIGHKVVIYFDPNVSFGGKLVGGIRIRAPKTATPSAQSPMDAAKRAALKKAQDDALALAAKNNSEAGFDPNDDIPFDNQEEI